MTMLLYIFFRNLQPYNMLLSAPLIPVCKSLNTPQEGPPITQPHHIILPLLLERDFLQATKLLTSIKGPNPLESRFFMSIQRISLHER